MPLAKAFLIKRCTDDGMVEFRDDVPLGKMYDVGLDSVRTVTLCHLERGVLHRKEIIDAYDGRDDAGWLPTELLRIES